MPASVSLSRRRVLDAVGVAGPGTAVLTSCGDSASGSRDGSGGTVVEWSHIKAARSGGRRLVGAAYCTPNCW
ncbi:hypothetical protein AB0M68_42565 [Streptomyces sp. NPDC051453]|uniref:hypothetical protein n=1 Tax=Streptomyces sp. NPDC051453 TaxID=3154941 RepID=UPI003434F534